MDRSNKKLEDSESNRSTFGIGPRTTQANQRLKTKDDNNQNKANIVPVLQQVHQIKNDNQLTKVVEEVNPAIKGGEWLKKPLHNWTKAG